MRNEIICGDSIQIIKNIPSCTIHAIISDIPYGIGYDDWDVLHENTNSALGGTCASQKEGGSLFKRRGKPLNGWSEADKQIPLEYQKWCESWASDWFRLLLPGASCFVFAGRRYAHRCIIALENIGFTFKDMLAWFKQSAAHRAQRLSEIYRRRGDLQNANVWEGWRVANLRPLFEPILWFQKPYRTGGTIADNVLAYGVGGWNEQALKHYNRVASEEVASHILRVATAREDWGKHITQKPLQLMELLVSLVTRKGDIVLDPFAGSGTTCVAAHRLERNYIGIEISEENVAIAKKRLEESYTLSLPLS